MECNMSSLSFSGKKNVQYNALYKTFGLEFLFLACNHEILQVQVQYFMVTGQK